MGEYLRTWCDVDLDAIRRNMENIRQKAGENIYGKSITDPCLGWEKTEKLIYEIADLI